MPRRPTILPPRPTTATCRCGAVYAVAPKGPEPLLCPRCARERVRVSEALRILRAAEKSGWLESSEPGSDAVVLRRLAQRFDPVQPADAIDEILDDLERAALSPERAGRIARRMSAAAKRLMRREGLMDGRGVLR